MFDVFTGSSLWLYTAANADTNANALTNPNPDANADANARAGNGGHSKSNFSCKSNRHGIWARCTQETRPYSNVPLC